MVEFISFIHLRRGRLGDLQEGDSFLSPFNRSRFLMFVLLVGLISISPHVRDADTDRRGSVGRGDGNTIRFCLLELHFLLGFLIIGCGF